MPFGAALATAADFNPRTPCGVRRSAVSPSLRSRYFNPRTPCGVRRDRALFGGVYQHFNPRTPCGVRPGVYVPGRGRGNISIHAPLAGCDIPAYLSGRVPEHFNPRTPCGVRRRGGWYLRRCDYFNPRTPCGVRLPFFVHAWGGSDFNPRTPCGVRQGDVKSFHARDRFQSTHPLRGATDANDNGIVDNAISIHAPLAGCD